MDGQKKSLKHQLRALGKGSEPVLLLHGEQDDIVTPEQVLTLRRLIPGAEFRSIDDVAHAFLITDPDRVAPR